LQDTGGVQTTFDHLRELKPRFAFLVNSFNINITGDGCPVRQPFVTNRFAVELNLTEMQEDKALKHFSQFHSTDDFR